MKVVAALKEGWKQVVMHRRMWLILYLSNLVFAVVATIAFRGWLKGIAGQSLAITKNLGQFDFTFITDLIRNYEGLSILCYQALVIVMAYLIFSAFLVGGILSMFVRHDRFSVKEFMADGAMYFWRMLRLALYFLVIHLVVIGIFIGVLMMIGINPKHIESDVQFLMYLKVLMPGYLLIAFLVAILHMYVKIHVVRQNANPMMMAFRGGITFVFRHFGSVVLLYAINVVLFVALFIIYTQVKHFISPSTGILAGFLMSQLFLIGRIGIKLLTLSSANQLEVKSSSTPLGS